MIERIKEINRLLDRYKREANEYKTWVPPGHYYSPIPDKQEVEKYKDRIFQFPKQIPNIDIDAGRQLSLLSLMAQSGNSYNTPVEKETSRRYYYNNDDFSFGDGVIANCILDYHKPKKIIQVGEGYSCALMLDYIQRVSDKSEVAYSVVRDNSGKLDELLNPNDRVVEYKEHILEIGLQPFRDLESGDLLFIDSTHVSKVGGDVNFLIFNVFPILKPGVLIQIHDISPNFEYPYHWIMEGRSWSENYLVRAFLMNNANYEIMFFNSYMGYHHLEEVCKFLPIFKNNPGGSLWLRKIR